MFYFILFLLTRAWREFLPSLFWFFRGICNFLFLCVGDGEGKGSNEENRGCNKPSSDLFKASKWSSKESLWAICSLWCTSSCHSLLPEWKALWVLKFRVRFPSLVCLRYVCTCYTNVEKEMEMGWIVGSVSSLC